MLSSVSYDLTGQYIENLTLTGTSAINGTGTSLAQYRWSATPRRTCSMAMAGSDDILRGGKGNDTYIVDQVGDKAYELNERRHWTPCCRR